MKPKSHFSGSPYGSKEPVLKKDLPTDFNPPQNIRELINRMNRLEGYPAAQTALLKEINRLIKQD